jgi:putative SbcD/Mre11-related phosphoesterase
MKPYELTKDFIIYDLALYIKSINTLVISDIHIGYEEAINKQGFLIPRFQYKLIKNTLSKIFSKIKNIDKIIILGDLKHEFGTISKQEWNNTLNLINYLETKCNKIILTKGNHDTIIEPLNKSNKLEILDTYEENNILFCHGHKIPKIKKSIKTIIIGHEHPAISIKSSVRKEVFKTILIGKYKNTELIIMPSLSQISEGTDILTQKLLSPFLKNINLKEFKALIIADKIYEIEKIKNLDFI